MTLGLLPALGGGIRPLAESGQASRLVDGYLRPYIRAFDAVSYFTYLPERLEEFTDDPELLRRVRVLAPSRPVDRGWRALRMPWAHAAEFRAASLLRVFQVTGVIPALIAQARFGVPYVTTYGFWYGELSRRGPRRLLKRVVERVGLRRAAAVIATTEELRARALRLAQRVELVPNGVDTRLFAPRPERARPGGGPRRILYVGRLAPEKNLEAVVTATAYVGPSARLVAAGSGILRGDLEARAAAEGASVEFLGVVDQRALPAVYRSADAFVLASFTEGHPKALLEAMACGLPCVASDCAGNRSLIEDGRTGLLFDPRSPRGLARCLERVLTDDALAARLGRAARDLVTARYDLGALVAREIDLLRSVGRPAA